MAMPKASCKYEAPCGEYVICTITKDVCGHLKYCRAENRWKLSENAIYCTIPNKHKEANDGK